MFSFVLGSYDQFCNDKLWQALTNTRLANPVRWEITHVENPEDLRGDVGEPQRQLSDLVCPLSVHCLSIVCPLSVHVYRCFVCFVTSNCKTCSEAFMAWWSHPIPAYPWHAWLIHSYPISSSRTLTRSQSALHCVQTLHPKSIQKLKVMKRA
jgi:hypothetical protein